MNAEDDSGARNKWDAGTDAKETKDRSWRSFLWFTLGLGVPGFVLGLFLGPVGGWHSPDVGDRLSNGGLLFLAGIALGLRGWTAKALNDD